jgi:hypothetical protein
MFSLKKQMLGAHRPRHRCRNAACRVQRESVPDDGLVKRLAKAGIPRVGPMEPPRSLVLLYSIPTEFSWNSATGLPKKMLTELSTVSDGKAWLERHLRRLDDK